MSKEIAVLVGDAVQWRFMPHRVDADEAQVITPRQRGYPPVPIGAVLMYQSGDVLGRVETVTPTDFQRWVLHYIAEGEHEAQPQPEEKPEVQPDTEPDPAVYKALADTNLNVRLVGILSEAGMHTVEDVIVFIDENGEEALQDLDGIGPKSMAEIRLIVAQEITAKEAK